MNVYSEYPTFVLKIAYNRRSIKERLEVVNVVYRVLVNSGFNKFISNTNKKIENTTLKELRGERIKKNLDCKTVVFFSLARLQRREPLKALETSVLPPDLSFKDRANSQKIRLFCSLRKTLICLQLNIFSHKKKLILFTRLW